MESLFNIIQLVTVFLLINTSSSIFNEKNFQMKHLYHIYIVTLCTIFLYLLFPFWIFTFLFFIVSLRKTASFILSHFHTWHFMWFVCIDVVSNKILDKTDMIKWIGSLHCKRLFVTSRRASLQSFSWAACQCSDSSQTCVWWAWCNISINHNIEWNIIMTITDDQALTLHIARLQVRSGATIILCVAGQCTLDIYIVITAQETVNNSDQDKLLFVKLNVCHTLESTQMTN